MTISVIVGLAIQVASVYVLHRGIRGQWMRHIGALFLGAAVAYHGVTEIMQAVFPNTRNSYRPMIAQADLERWILLVSIAMLCYSIAYAVVWRHFWQNRLADSTPDGRQGLEYFQNLNPWWLVAPAVPLLYFTATGSGGTGLTFSGQARTGADYVIGGFATQYLIVLVAIAGAVFVAKYGVKWLLPTLLAESCLLAMAGDRRSLLFGCIITLYALRVADVRLPRKVLAIGLSVAVMLVLTVSASRAVVGRDSFWAGSGATARTDALMAGGKALGSAKGWEGIKNDTVYRLDGNSFGTLVDDSISQGVPAVGMTTMRGNMRSLVPSFLFPGKNDAPLEVRNEEAFIQRHFSFGSTTDFLPGMFGTVIAYYGRFGMLVISLILGLLFAGIDILVRRRRNPVALIFGCAVALPALLYETGPAGLLVSARGAVVLAAVVWLFLLAGRSLTDGRHRHVRPARN